MAQRNANKGNFAPLSYSQPKPFKIQFPKEDLDELRKKLEWIRWGPKSLLMEEDERKDSGLLPSQELMKKLTGQWIGLDFEKVQEKMNSQPNFTCEIDWCKPLHFVHKRSSRKDAIPIILIHGWPGSFYEFYWVIDQLCEPKEQNDQAFHVVIPSLPGYAWSKAPPSKEQGVGDVDGYARILDTLMMEVLGYKSYAAQGGDWGSGVARCLAAKYARSDGKTGCRAVHLNFSPIVPQWAWALAALPEWLTAPVQQRAPGELGANLRKMDGFRKSMVYYWVQHFRPQQLAHGLTDSPVGLLSWLAFFWALKIDSTPTFTAETMLSVCTVYFITRSIGTSFLPYHNNDLLSSIHGDSAYNVRKGNLGYSDFPDEIVNCSYAWMKSSGNLKFYAKSTKGGHYAALEEPEIFVNHLRIAFANHTDSQANALNKNTKQLLQNNQIHSATITGSLWPSHLRSRDQKQSHL